MVCLGIGNYPYAGRPVDGFAGFGTLIVIFKAMPLAIMQPRWRQIGEIMVRLLALSMLAGLILVSASPARAGAAEDAFLRGAFEEARDLGVASGAAGDLVIAARSLNALAYFSTDRREARTLANDALSLAETAIDRAPDLVEAHLQAAISLSLRGANMVPVKALFLNLPSRARTAIDRALALDPENAFALSTSGAWRIEVARRGGGGVFGANPEQGFQEFQRARAIDPGNLSVAYECALRLFADGRPEWHEPARAALDAALNATPASAYEERLKGRAQAMHAAVSTSPEALKDFIDRYA